MQISKFPKVPGTDDFAYENAAEDQSSTSDVGADDDNDNNWASFLHGWGWCWKVLLRFSLKYYFSMLRKQHKGRSTFSTSFSRETKSEAQTVKTHIFHSSLRRVLTIESMNKIHSM